MNTVLTATVHSITIKGPSDTMPAVMVSPTLLAEVQDKAECELRFGRDLARCIYGRDDDEGEMLAAQIKPAIPLAVHIAEFGTHSVRCYPSFFRVDIDALRVVLHLRLPYLQEGSRAATTYLIDHMRQPVEIELTPAQQELPGMDAEEKP